jgi:hypothetical protein
MILITQVPKLYSANHRTMLTGGIRVPSRALRTKDSAVHAGLSQPSAAWKVSRKSEMVTYNHSVSNNLLIALVRVNTEIKDAMEVN